VIGMLFAMISVICGQDNCFFGLPSRFSTNKYDFTSSGFSFVGPTIFRPADSNLMGLV
jgi:hypothetical protein